MLENYYETLQMEASECVAIIICAFLGLLVVGQLAIIIHGINKESKEKLTKKDIKDVAEQVYFEIKHKKLKE